MAYYFNWNFKESIYNNKYWIFLEWLKTFIIDDEKLLLYNENLKKLDWLQLLFFWIKIKIQCDECIKNFMNIYNIQNDKKNEIKNHFNLFINSFNVLF